MAEVKRAIDFVLTQEDRSMSGKVTTLKGDRGGATRFGIASKFHPALVSAGFFDETCVDRDSALSLAEQVYANSYAAPLRIGEIKDQRIATAVLSFGINSGIGQAAKLLQQACIECHRKVTVDGIVGRNTITAVNVIDPGNLLTAFTVLAKTYYSDLAANNPNDRAFLNGWVNRADAWGEAA